MIVSVNLIAHAGTHRLQAYDILSDPVKLQKWQEYGDENGPQDYEERFVWSSCVLLPN